MARNEIIHSSTLQLTDTQVARYLQMMIIVLEDAKTLRTDPLAKAAAESIKQVNSASLLISNFTVFYDNLGYLFIFHQTYSLSKVKKKVATHENTVLLHFCSLLPILSPLVTVSEEPVIIVTTNSQKSVPYHSSLLDKHFPSVDRELL